MTPQDARLIDAANDIHRTLDRFTAGSEHAVATRRAFPSASGGQHLHDMEASEIARARHFATERALQANRPDIAFLHMRGGMKL
jgi:hypothetical protein